MVTKQFKTHRVTGNRERTGRKRPNYHRLSEMIKRKADEKEMEHIRKKNELIRLEIRAYINLLSDYEEKKESFSYEIWEDPNNVDCKDNEIPHTYAGYIETSHGKPFLLILESFGDDKQETPASIKKQNEWQENFDEEIKDRRAYARDIACTIDILNDDKYFV